MQNILVQKMKIKKTKVNTFLAYSGTYKNLQPQVDVSSPNYEIN